MLRSPAYLSSPNHFEDDLDKNVYDPSFPNRYPHYAEYSLYHATNRPLLNDISIYDSIPRAYYECLPDVYSYSTYPYLHPNIGNPYPIREELGYHRFHTPIKGDHVLMSSPNEHYSPRIMYPNAHPRSQCSYPRALPDQYGCHIPPSHGSVENQPGKSPYLEYLIDVRSVINGQNKRLTVMLRNVPNRYTPADLKKVLDTFIYKKYQIVTFPNDVKTHRNLGYAFISLSDNPSLLTLYRHMHNEYWPNSNNQKVCRICHSIDKKNKK